jgi:hypothetical protein
VAWAGQAGWAAAPPLAHHAPWNQGRRIVGLGQFLAVHYVPFFHFLKYFSPLKFPKKSV